MLPIILDAANLKIGLAGDGESAARRLAHLRAAGLEPVRIVDPTRDPLEGLHLLYVAGMAPQEAAGLAARARAASVLVNVEDMPALCDFHVPATIRRGHLLVTVSTGGRSPGLVALLRQWLAARLGDVWAERVEMAAQHRAGWQAAGLSPSDIATRTRSLAEREKWLP